jgi:hypothetical protein
VSITLPYGVMNFSRTGSFLNQVDAEVQGAIGPQSIPHCQVILELVLYCRQLACSDDVVLNDDVDVVACDDVDAVLNPDDIVVGDDDIVVVANDVDIVGDAFGEEEDDDDVGC